MKSLEERFVDTKLERKRLTGITHAQNAKTRAENLTNQADGNRCETFVGMTWPCKRVQAILFAFDNVTTPSRFPRYTCLFFFFPYSIYILFVDFLYPATKKPVPEAIANDETINAYVYQVLRNYDIFSSHDSMHVDLGEFKKKFSSADCHSLIC